MKVFLEKKCLLEVITEIHQMLKLLKNHYIKKKPPKKTILENYQLLTQ